MSTAEKTFPCAPTFDSPLCSPSDDILKRAGRMCIFRRCELTACPPPSSSASTSRQIRKERRGKAILRDPHVQLYVPIIFSTTIGESLLEERSLYLDNSFVLVMEGDVVNFEKFETRNTNFII